MLLAPKTNFCHTTVPTWGNTTCKAGRLAINYQWFWSFMEGSVHFFTCLFVIEQFWKELPAKMMEYTTKHKKLLM